ncbi:MAG: MerR family transcriptional regulator [Candidatus Eremiobacteraeota bacterium]|nr:MerR family transcriptional regulator [Candidatus Eremiobacteraeota bacterium]
MNTTFTVGEIARRTAVTVRTLHHYEQVGLLVPSERTASGHRRYGARDVVRLRRIVTLTAIGIPLREIAALLDASPQDALVALRAQREQLAERRDRLDASIERIDALVRRASENDGALDRGELESLMETIAMENWAHRYMTEVQGMSPADAEAAIRSVPPEAAEGTRKWSALIADVEAALAENVAPSSERAQALAQRWRELIESFTGGDPKKHAQVVKFYADLPRDFPKPYSDAVQAFIHEAMAAQER